MALNLGDMVALSVREMSFDLCYRVQVASSSDRLIRLLVSVDQSIGSHS